VSQELNFKMLKWQREVLQDPTRFKVVVSGRRAGKTMYSLVQTVIKALECKDTTGSVMLVAPTFGMAKVLFWDQLLHLCHPVIASSNVNDGLVKLINGVKIYVKGSDNPDSLRGMKLYHVTMDEYQDAKEGTFQYIIRPALSDMKGTAVFIGSPKPDATEFRRIYDLGQTGEDTEWKSWLFKTKDNELIDPKEIEAARRSMSTPAYLQEYEAEWDTTGANLLKLEWFNEVPEPSSRDYSTYIAIDPAGYENVSASETQKKKHLDYFAIAIGRLYDDGTWWIHSVPHGRWDVREAAVRVLLAVRNHRPMMVGIEKGSLMRAVLPYLEDISKKNNVHFHVEPIATSGSSKVNRISYSLQGLMEHNRIKFNAREDWTEFKKEMLGFPSNRVHDDLLDATSMLMHLAQATYGKGGGDAVDDYEVVSEICGF
jgi:predicted phage terminase large subunit-like protein